MRVGSVFAGIGGFDLAFGRAGAQVIWNCEIDAKCRSVLRHHWPGTPRFKDVKTVTGSGLGAAGLRPDCLVGGFPCQDLSVAGARAGLAGERSGLFFEFARILDEAKPRWFLLENVPGLLSSDRGRDMGVLLSTLVNLGYGVAWRVLDAQYFGVAQRRRRVFIVGCLGDGARAREVLLVGEGGGGDPPARRAAGAEVAGTLGGGSGSRGWCDDLDRATFIPAVSHALCSTRGQRNDPNEQTFVPVTFRKATKAHHAEDWERWEETDRTDTLTDRDGTAPATAVVQELAVRRLTPTECLRLQAFPDGWLDDLGLADSVKYRMVGNAVCVNVAEWIAKRMVSVGGST